MVTAGVAVSVIALIAAALSRDPLAAEEPAAVARSSVATTPPLVPAGQRVRATRVLILYGVAPEHPALAPFTNHFRNRLRASLKGPVEFYEEYLDLARFNFPGRMAQLARAHREKYSGHRFDVVIAAGYSALAFATDPTASLFHDAPIVFALTVAHRVNVATLPPNVTGRLAGRPFVETVDLARRLQPDANHVVVVTGASRPDSNFLVGALLAIEPFRHVLKTTVLRGLAYSDLMGAVEKLPSRTFVIVANFERDGNGNHFAPVEIVERVAQRANAPVYANVANGIGRGIVGGPVAQYDLEGTLTADLVMRVLSRAPGSRMPPLETRSHSIQVDWRQLRRWGLSEKLLPAGAIVRFHEVSVWERYRTAIVIALLLFALQSVLTGQLLVEHQRRVRAQRAIEDQLAYERLISGLTADMAAEDGDDISQVVLVRALARLGTYFGARSAVLADYADGGVRCVRWPLSRAGDDADPRWETPTTDPKAMVMPLVAGGTRIGTIELHPGPDTNWTERQVARVRLACDVVAGEIGRKHAARAANRSEQLSRAVLDSVSAQIAILDDSGRIVQVNDAWRQSASRAGVESGRDAFVGSNYLEECCRASERGDAAANDVRRGLEAVLAGEVWRYRVEYQTTVPERWYELYVDRLGRPEGGAVVTHFDITDRRLAELRAEESRQQVAHMARVLTLGELAATLVHELGQPLTAIGNNAHAGAHLMSSPARSSGELKAIFGDISADQARAADTVRRVHAMLRKDRPRLERVNVNEVCCGVRTLLRADAARRRATIELSLDPADPTVMVDPIQLQQAVINLALNGLEAVSGSNGLREVLLCTTVGEDTAGLFVYDSGPGLPRAVGELLFEPFFSTKPQGLGMGLAIVRSFVERHGGHVHAENRTPPARGAVFRIVLPLAAPLAAPERVVSENGPRKSGETVAPFAHPEREVGVAAGALPQSLQSTVAADASGEHAIAGSETSVH